MKLTQKIGNINRRYNLYVIIGIFALVILICGILYSLIMSPDTSLADGMYISILTMSTLGYADIHPVGGLSKTLASIQVLSGIILMGFLIAKFTSQVIHEASYYSNDFLLYIPGKEDQKSFF